MSLKSMYYYLFYKIYHFMGYLYKSESANKFRAIMLTTFIEIWLVEPFYIYLNILTKKRSTINLISFSSIPFIIIVIVKWIAFIHDDTWKVYVKKFETWPIEKNKKGTIYVIGLVFMIVLNLIIAACCSSKMQQ